MPRSYALVAGLASLLVTWQALADLPPPDGKRFVNYGFTVSGIPAGSDRVLFAYPCSSGGMPEAAQQKIEDGVAVNAGRRGGSCAIYSIAKRDYEAFLKGYEPTKSTSDPALEAFVKRASACQGGPTPTHVLPTSDPRSTVHELLTVKTLTATACVLETRGHAQPTAPGPHPSPPSPAATPATTPPATPPATPAPATSPPKTSSCAVTPQTDGRDASLLALLGAALAAWVGRRRG